MENLLRKVVELLKERVRTNLCLVNANQDIINQILALQSDEEKEERKNEFEMKFNKNKELLNANDDFIKLQLEIVKFVEKYKHTGLINENNDDITNAANEYSKDEVFDLTVDDVIPFNEKHPFFNDSEFFNDLISYYVNREKYERCNELKKIKS